MKRGGGLRRRRPLERSPLERNASFRSSRRPRPVADRAFRADPPRTVCPVCGLGPVTDPHHVLYQKHIRGRARTEKWMREVVVQVLSDVRNRLWVCRDCNVRQESAPTKPMRRRHVPASAWEFAVELGEWAVVRLERDYPA